MKEIGDLLKKTRMEKNLTLEEISSQTKIQLAILRRIEDGNTKDLPHEAHLKGFIRQYSKLLGLDADDVIAMFNKDNTTPATPIRVRQASNTSDSKTNVLWFRAPAKLITFIGIIVVSILVISIYTLSMKIDSYSQETFQELEASEQDKADNPNMQTTLTLPNNEVSEREEKQTKAAQADPKMVAVEAFEEVSISAQWSTGKEEKITLKKNRKHTFYYSEKIKLNISNAGVVNVITSKKTLGKPGDLGQAIELAFD